MVPVREVVYVMATSSETMISSGSTMQAFRAMARLYWAHQKGPVCVCVNISSLQSGGTIMACCMWWGGPKYLLPVHQLPL